MKFVLIESVQEDSNYGQNVGVSKALSIKDSLIFK